jgi:hypothetical protein
MTILEDYKQKGRNINSITTETAKDQEEFFPK